MLKLKRMPMCGYSSDSSDKWVILLDINRQRFNRLAELPKYTAARDSIKSLDPGQNLAGMTIVK